MKSWLIRRMGTAHTLLYRATRGKIGATIRDLPILLLTTTGRRTGKQRTSPLGYIMDSPNYVVIASFGGGSRDPAWLFNIRANPRVTVQAKGVQRKSMAEVAPPEERSRLWARIVKVAPVYESYQGKTDREIQVVLLRPEHRGGECEDRR